MKLFSRLGKNSTISEILIYAGVFMVFIGVFVVMDTLFSASSIILDPEISPGDYKTIITYTNYYPELIPLVDQCLLDDAITESESRKIGRAFCKAADNAREKEARESNIKQKLKKIVEDAK